MVISHGRLLVIGLWRVRVIGGPRGLGLRLVGVLVGIGVVGIKIGSLARVYKSGVYGRRIKRRMRVHQIIFGGLIFVASGVPVAVNLGLLLRSPL